MTTANLIDGALTRDEAEGIFSDVDVRVRQIGIYSGYPVPDWARSLHSRLGVALGRLCSVCEARVADPRLLDASGRCYECRP